MTARAVAERASTRPPLRVLHVATSLEVGGAQMMLLRLVRALDRDGFAHEVVALTGEGPVAEPLRRAGARVEALGLDRRAPDPRRIARLGRLVRAARPDLVQTWMYHADLVGGLAARLAGRKVIWGIHNATLPAGARRTTRWTRALCARLSRRIPERIVAVASAARDVHVALGYDASRFVVIPNGFDLAEYRADPAQRAAVRAELGAGPDALLVGLVARWDPQKDHATFLRAAALLARRVPAARFVLCGDGITADNPELARLVAEAGVRDRVLLLGRRGDVPRIMSALDVGTLSSIGEAFPLVVGEAMACGVPCVVTDVGDAALVVGDTGVVVPPRDPAALAAGWEELARAGADGRRTLGEAARARIAARYGLEATVAAYADLYRSVASGSGSPA